MLSVQTKLFVLKLALLRARSAPKVIWNFFATPHGKGVVDGLGGTVKRAEWRHVRSGKVHMTTAEE